MAGMDGSSKPPQISQMFHKFAVAFKTKTFDFFADDADDDESSNLLDSAEEFITDQKVVVIKPDSSFEPAPPPSHSPSVTAEPPLRSSSTRASAQKGPISTEVTQTLIYSLFATVSSLKASYLLLQTAHAPFDEEGLKAADRAVLSQLQTLSNIKRLYKNFSVSADSNLDCSIGSCLESQVQENQSMLRTLETVVNLLQSEIDGKQSEVLTLRQRLDKIQKSNKELSTKLNGITISSSSDILLSVGVFDSILRDTRSSVYKFTKLLILLMKRAGWDLEMAAKSVHPDVDYAERGHYRYSLLSYACLRMFQDFDSEDFRLESSEASCNGFNDMKSWKNHSMKELLEHLSSGPLEALSRNPNSDFSKFCEKKYQLIIHPTMESSIFSNQDGKEAILCSWKSLGVFYEAFVNMASSIWVLHKLAFSFDPKVEIFQVERGAEFSIVYMEDAARRCVFPGKTRPGVGFTVVPGFRIGKTVIQSKVYLGGFKCTDG